MNEYCIDFTVYDIEQFVIVEAYDESQALEIFKRNWGEVDIIDINEMNPDQ